ncbi:hypothetical protein GCM10007939_08050 [Amylibacter marinus]|uniref:MAPEG family protein n=1 Tax=Amylibacter marinus TaxID=1475483 RepID=A0ABQ5VTD6_9RHOB|nr:MAPEG family protein [Amylibacter marinus]GLQ34522.1 hypothetical protein GCM10007939_08050 [Amylibacter marinus]
MTPEIFTLALAGLLHVALMLLYVAMVGLTVPLRDSVGNRDQPLNITGKSARVKRTMNNSFEALILFAVAAICVMGLAKSTPQTETYALVFLLARIAYIPCYIFALGPFRTIMWAIGLGATTLMLIAAVI